MKGGRLEGQGELDLSICCPVAPGGGQARTQLHHDRSFSHGDRELKGPQIETRLTIKMA